VPVNHRPRHHGTSNYGVFDRLSVGIVDLLGVMWLRRRAARPQLIGEPPTSQATAPSARVAQPAQPVL
jgi:dolichol-phosphate mannosyltransferase